MDKIAVESKRSESRVEPPDSRLSDTSDRVQWGEASEPFLVETTAIVRFLRRRILFVD